MSKRFGATPSDGALSIDEEVGFRENLDPEQLVRLQINRCNIMLTAGDEVGFANGVRGLLASIPSGKRGEVESEKRAYLTRRGEILAEIERLLKAGKDTEKFEEELESLDESSYIRKVGRLKYEYYCGVRLGTEDKPLLNRDGTPRSPVWIEEDKIDYYKLFTTIQDKLEQANLSWRIEQINEEGGKIPDDKKRIPPPTPTLAPGVNLPEGAEEEEEDE